MTEKLDQDWKRVDLPTNHTLYYRVRTSDRRIGPQNDRPFLANGELAIRYELLRAYQFFPPELSELEDQLHTRRRVFPPTVGKDYVHLIPVWIYESTPEQAYRAARRAIQKIVRQTVRYHSRCHWLLHESAGADEVAAISKRYVCYLRGPGSTGTDYLAELRSGEIGKWSESTAIQLDPHEWLSQFRYRPARRRLPRSASGGSTTNLMFANTWRQIDRSPDNFYLATFPVGITMAPWADPVALGGLVVRYIGRPTGLPGHYHYLPRAIPQFERIDHAIFNYMSNSSSTVRDLGRPLAASISSHTLGPYLHESVPGCFVDRDEHHWNVICQETFLFGDNFLDIYRLGDRLAHDLVGYLSDPNARYRYEPVKVGEYPTFWSGEVMISMPKGDLCYRTIYPVRRHHPKPGGPTLPVGKWTRFDFPSGIHTYLVIYPVGIEIGAYGVVQLVAYAYLLVPKEYKGIPLIPISSFFVGTRIDNPFGRDPVDHLVGTRAFDRYTVFALEAKSKSSWLGALLDLERMIAFNLFGLRVWSEGLERLMQSPGIELVRSFQAICALSDDRIRPVPVGVPPTESRR